MICSCLAVLDGLSVQAFVRDADSKVPCDEQARASKGGGFFCLMLVLSRRMSQERGASGLGSHFLPGPGSPL